MAKQSAASESETSIFDLDDDGVTPDASAVDADSQMEAIEASIESSLKILNDNEKPKRLTMQLIRQSVSMAVKQSARRLITQDDDDDDGSPESPSKDDDESEIDSLLQKKVLRLDWMSLSKIENLEAFTHIEELYLQHNLIETIENLDDHSDLTFLALGGNRIKTVSNIKHLTNLKFLDLSNNAIEDFDIREFPPSLVILRLAGNPFTRHMPAYMHLFFERLPNLKQVDQYRRVPSHLVEGSPVGSPSGSSPLSFSPRSRISELQMEVEMSQKQHTQREASPATANDEDAAKDDSLSSSSDWSFDSAEYAKQKQERMAKWTQQLHDLETRQRELESDIPVITRSTSTATVRARRKRLIASARDSTDAAIAESMAHFQEMELQHQEWQERQHQAA